MKKEYWILGDKAHPNGHIVPDKYKNGILCREVDPARDVLFDEMVKALEFIANQEHLTFTECSVAEEIWSKASTALAKSKGIK